jgi:hypothetical protein
MSLKRLLTFLLVGFFLFFMVQAPADAARVVQTAGEGLGDVLSSLAHGFTKFLRSMF